MRPTSAFISGMATMGVLAGGIAFGTGFANGATTNDTTSTDTTASSGNGNSNGSTTPAASSGNHDGTYDGDVIQTQYGPMQVEIVIAGGTITDAKTLQQPGSDRTSQQINAQVIPILVKATTDYQSVQFGNVSRATISTNAYKESAQSALDQAGFTG